MFVLYKDGCFSKEKKPEEILLMIKGVRMSSTMAVQKSNGKLNL